MASAPLLAATWQADPLLIRLVIVGVAVVMLGLAVRLMQAYVPRTLQDSYLAGFPSCRIPTAAMTPAS